MRKVAIAFGFKGVLYEKILEAQKILKNHLNIKYMSIDHSLPHITLISGKSKNTNLLYNALKKNNFKKFKIKSPGLGIFANNKPNLYLRWESGINKKKITKSIIKKTSPFFSSIDHNSKDELWVAKTTIAWNDLKYSHFEELYKKIQFMFSTHSTIIKSIYVIDYTIKETITHTINLDN